MSFASSSGVSRAAKWPPRGISLQCTMRLPNCLWTQARGGTLISLGKRVKPRGAGGPLFRKGLIDLGRGCRLLSGCHMKAAAWQQSLSDDNLPAGCQSRSEPPVSCIAGALASQLPSLAVIDRP